MPIEKETITTLVKHEAPFTILPNESIALIKDPTALAIWVYLCSKPNTWIVRRADVCTHFGFGIDKYQGAMRILRDLGFVSQRRIRDDDGTILCNELIVSAAPVLNRERENPAVDEQRAQPYSGKTNLRLIPPLSKEVEDLSKKRLPTKKRVAKTEILIPDDINKIAWSAWIDYRKSKKKSVSPKAAILQFQFLRKHSLEQQGLIINQSIFNDYQGLFELKGNGNGTYQSITPKPDNSAAGRVRANIERGRAERNAIAGCDGRPVGQDGETVRAQMGEQLWGSSGPGPDMGSVITGSFSRTD